MNRDITVRFPNFFPSRLQANAKVREGTAHPASLGAAPQLSFWSSSKSAVGEVAEWLTQRAAIAQYLDDVVRQHALPNDRLPARRSGPRAGSDGLPNRTLDAHRIIASILMRRVIHETHADHGRH